MAKDTLGLVGQTLHNLRFDAIVDEGGFGYVYRGRHLGLDEPIAIKCLKALGASEELGSFEARFRDETKIAYRLSQGSLDIVRSISSGTLTTPAGLNVPYMVLEWLDGRPLSVELVARRKNGLAPFTFEQTLAMMESAAHALAHAHSEGVIHRDVKPSNLFVAETRDGRRVKVLDFGLAKILTPDTFMTPEASPTASHVFVCSPAYGAPEQFSKELGALGPATDVYSFAFVLMEMMSGKKVREAGTIMEGMLKAIDARFASPSPSSLGLALRGPVERVLCRAVAMDPKERWKDASAFWAALKEAATAPETSGPTLVDPPKKGGLAVSMEEARRRAATFEGLALGGGKGGTLGMPLAAPPQGNPESTVKMTNRPESTGLPAASPIGAVTPGAAFPPSGAVRTLPLDAKLPPRPLTVPPAFRPTEPAPAPAPRAPVQSVPPPEVPLTRTNVVPWIVALLVLLLAAASVVALRSRAAR